jgi:hypothetical protein
MTWTTTIGDWTEEAKLLAEGRDVAVYENIVVVGGAGIYHSYLGSLIDEGATINGSTVAICDRDTVITGYPYSDGDMGIVYVYAWNPAGMGAWEEIQMLEALDKSASALFGCAIAAYGDIIAIGANGADGNGAVYVFTRPHGADPFADKASLDLARLAHAKLDIATLTTGVWNTVIESIAQGLVGPSYTFASVNAGMDCSGVGCSFLRVADNVTLSDPTNPFLPIHVGRTIEVWDSTTPGNDGLFIITAVAVDGSSCTYANVTGATEVFGIATGAGVSYRLERIGTDFTLCYTSGVTTVTDVETMIDNLIGADQLIQVKTYGTTPGYILTELIDPDDTFPATHFSMMGTFNTVIESITSGIIGNSYTFACTPDGGGADSIIRVGTDFTLHFTSGVTTVADVEALIAALPEETIVTGVGCSFSFAAGDVTISDPTNPFHPTDVSRTIDVVDSPTPGNDGTFTITAVAGGGGSCTYANAAGATEGFGVLTVATIQSDKLIQVKTPGTDPGYVLVDPDNTFTAVKLSNCFTEAKKLVASDAAFNDRFGSAVALDANTIIVGSPYNSEAESAAGAIYAYAIGAWSEQKLLVADPMGDDRLGKDRTLAVNGDTFIAGCPEKRGWAGTPFGIGAGVAYVFIAAGGVWSQAQKLVASEAEAGGRFGSAVSIDDHTIFVGASSGKPEE